MKKQYLGSCACGAIQFEVQLDLSHDSTTTSTRCNCRWCTKVRYWGLITSPLDFRLLKGESDLGDYSKSEAGHHRFCKHCGTQTFGHGHLPELGGDFCSVHLACLDGLTPEERAQIPIQYLDGLQDLWWQPPAITAYL